jgi:hypothetical protein
LAENELPNEYWHGGSMHTAIIKEETSAHDDTATRTEDDPPFATAPLPELRRGGSH